MTEDSTALHTKYRPKTLDDVVGNTAIVAQLKGIISTRKFPSAIAFFGPSSAGKTTLARAFASSVLGKSALGQADYVELNAGSSKSIDDIRGLADLARLRPTSGIRRFVMVDEAQQVLTNPQAAGAWLKFLEEPPKSTTWLLGSMDPEKFASTQNGRAITNRCQQFHLKPYSAEDLMTQAKRIIKGERLAYLGKAAAEAVVTACNGEMRTLANLIQSASQYYDGLEDKPEKLAVEDIQSVIKHSSSDDDVTMVRFLTAVYACKFGAAHRELLNVGDGFQFIQKALNANWYLLNNTILKGERHPKVWGSAAAQQLTKNLESLLTGSLSTRVQMYGAVQSGLTKLKAEAQAFAVPETMALSAFAFQTIEALKASQLNKES